MEAHMGWLCRSVTVLVLLSTLSVGCGSTAHDVLVLQFVRFDNTGLTQSDSVGEASADVDVIQDCCTVNVMTQTCTSVEPFTQTVINAVLRNNEASDIQLNSYSIHFDDPNVGLADTQNNTSAKIGGGRCTSIDQHCADDSDCISGTIVGSCIHTETTVNNILLFDIQAKLHVNPAVFGFATSISVTFFGADPNRHWQTTANYVVTFANFNNCTSTTGTGGA
jgi:hypothetical protein